MSDSTDNNGLCTSTWGNPGWFFLHSVAAGYPVDPDEFDSSRGNPSGHTRRVYTSFFKTVGGVLPCRFCRDSYDIFIKELPIDKYIHSRKSLFEWLFKIHNKVNEKLGVDEETDLESVVQKYESFRARCPKDKTSKGCTIPAENYTKMKCTVFIEPFHGCKTIPLLIIALLIIASLIVSIYRKQTT